MTVAEATREMRPRRPAQATAAGSAARWMLLFGAVSGLALVYLFPPFTFADEPAHFYRAFSLAEGHLFAQVREGSSGASLPVSLAHLVDLATTGLIRDLDARADADRMERLRAVQLVPEERRFFEFPNSAMLPFPVYLPQATGIVAARALGAGPLQLLRAARLANLFAALALTYLALRRAVDARWTLFTIALLPTVLALRSSCSPDALTFASVLLVAADLFGLEPAGDRARATHRLCASLVLLFATKLPYAPLAIAALPVLSRQRAAIPPRHRLLWGLAAAAALSLSSATLFSVRQSLRPEVPTSSTERIRDTIEDPRGFFAASFRTLKNRAARLGADAIGSRLGWLDVPVSSTAVAAIAVLLLLVVLRDRAPEGRLEVVQAAAISMAICAVILTVLFSQWITWTPPGSRVVRGLQGRYFLPVVPFALITIRALLPGGPAQERSSRLLALLCAAFSVAAVALAAWFRFWG